MNFKTAKSENHGDKWKNGGIKSKERARKYGEIFTPEWVVIKMCDYLEQENGRDCWRETVLDIFLQTLVQSRGIIEKCAFAV